MVEDLHKYLIDANVLMEANRRYYSLDFAPAFWNFLTRAAEEGMVFSIDRVYDEIMKGKDDLAEWTKKNFTFAFANTKDDEKVIELYAELMQWAIKQIQYTQAAIDEFARVENADAWLIAYAKVHNYLIVTQEVLDLNIKKKIPIPNVCEQFDIKYINTFQMLRELKFKFS